MGPREEQGRREISAPPGPTPVATGLLQTSPVLLRERDLSKMAVMPAPQGGWDQSMKEGQGPHQEPGPQNSLVVTL